MPTTQFISSAILTSVTYAKHRLRLQLQLRGTSHNDGGSLRQHDIEASVVLTLLWLCPFGHNVGRSWTDTPDDVRNN